jgi:hypothetical protein
MITFSGIDDFDLIKESRYSPNDVLLSRSARLRRRAHLLQAVALESLEQTEVVLTLEHEYSCSKLRSRIIATGDENVVLEKGLSIPIRSIHRIEFLS